MNISFSSAFIFCVGMTFLACGGDGADVELALDGDIRTPAAALAKARELRASGAVTGRPVEIRVGPGRYRLTEPVVLTSADSAVCFRGQSPRTTVFDGGCELKPFTVGADGVWVTDVPEGLEFDQLWVGGRRAQRARSPNRFYHYIKESDEELALRAFKVDACDIAPLASLPQDELSRVVVAVWHSWDMGYACVDSVSSVDAQTSRLVLKQNIGRPFFAWSSSRPRYTLENFRAALDAPGEWFHDVKAKKLLYVPRDGESVAKDSACVPVVTSLVTFAGDRAKGEIVHDVAFEGIGFEYTALPMQPLGVCASQAAASTLEAAVSGAGIENVRFQDCRIAHTGGQGLYLRTGCHRVMVRHCLMEDLGAGGVCFGLCNNRRQPRPDEVSSHLTVEDSIIRHGGRIMQAGVGVWMGHVHDCRVIHNEICDFFYTGVSLGWTWGYAPTANRDNLIAHNRIHHIGQGALSDMGGIYTLGDNTGSVVRNNWIWEVNGYAGTPAWGLYTDEGSHGIVFCDNLVEKCRDGVINQNYGSGNVYSNNLFLTFKKAGVWRNRPEEHVSFRVMNNVFWWTEPETKVYRDERAFAFAGSLPADNNVYWCAAGAVKGAVFQGADWEKWRGLGRDAHGVIADPLFADSEKGDWTLKPNSPALAHGFTPFDWRDAGVYKTDVEWRARSEEVCWNDFEDAPPAPKCGRDRLRADFEQTPVGAVDQSARSFAPLGAKPGRVGQIQIVDVDPAQGKKALKMIDAPDLKPDWTPIVTAGCCVDEGVAQVSFALKIEAGAKPTVELRDLPVGELFACGVRLTVADDHLLANGQDICALQPGVWHDVLLRMQVSGGKQGRWLVAVTPRGGETVRVKFEKFGDERFKELRWIGFMSGGATTSVWYLDDIKLDAIRGRDKQKGETR